MNKLQETVKLLTADNEEKQNALVDARAEVKELKEFMESVSTVSVCLTTILCACGSRIPLSGP